MDDDELSNISKRANEILKNHNGVYLEKKLFNLLKKEFPKLTRNNFQEVLKKSLEDDYTIQRGLIRRLPIKKSKDSPKDYNGTKPGKNDSDVSRLPDKRGI